jgi:hypothetical protein
MIRFKRKIIKNERLVVFWRFLAFFGVFLRFVCFFKSMKITYPTANKIDLYIDL